MPPIGEVGEGDDAGTAHTQHFLQNLVRIMHHLQSLGHDHHIKAVAGKVAQPQVQVLLDDIDALLDAGVDLVRTDLQAIAGDVLVLLEPGQQLAVATAQVQYSAVFGDPLLDDFQVGSHGQISIRFM